MAVTWELRNEDREFFANELEDFVPPMVYDMHAHLWHRSDWQDQPPEIVEVAPPEVGYQTYQQCISWILPQREVHAMFFQYPAYFPNDPVPCNEWVGSQIKKDRRSRGQFYVRPTDDPDWVCQEVKRLNMRGFKPFACFAARPDIENAEIPEYLPEWIPRLAHEHHWSITLHLQRAKSLADPSNIHWINTYCRKYPDMTLILDHCARGFNPYHLIEGLKQLDRHHNLYVDTSVICNPLAVWACIEFLGIDHVFYASDFYCSHLRGTNFPFGNSFMWIDQEPDLADQIPYESTQILIGLENLRTVKAVFRMLKLNEKDIEAYFWSNAARLLELD